MKPTSIIFLIIAAILVVGGFTTAGVAKQLAISEGTELVPSQSEEDDGYIFTYNFSNDSIAKITVDVKEAAINIIGGAEAPYIELVNFSEGMYDFSSSNRVLTVSENTDLTTLSGIATVVTNFKGLRSLVNYFRMSELEKTVNIYLSADYPVNVVNCSVETGNVTIENSVTTTDFGVNIGTGKLTVNGVKTTSAFDVSVASGSISVKDCEISKFNAAVTTGTVSLDAKIDRLDANVSTGDVIYVYRGSVSAASLKLFTNVGKITVDGEQLGGYKENLVSTTDNIIDISVGVGDIDIASTLTAD